MDWKAGVVLVAVGVAIGSIAVGGVHSVQAAPVTGGRYEIHGITVDEPTANELHEVFLLDTEAGRVWKYSSATSYKNADGTGGYIPETFEPVGISPKLIQPGK